MRHCSFPNCQSKQVTGSGLGFFNFPKDEQRQKWLELIGRLDWNPWKDARICGKHFVEGKPTKSNPYPVLSVPPPPPMSSNVGVEDSSPESVHLSTLTTDYRPRTYQGQVLYKAPGIVVQAPTPDDKIHPKYRDPTDPSTPNTERKRRLAEDEREAKERSKRPSKRRRLELGGDKRQSINQDSSPLHFEPLAPESTLPPFYLEQLITDSSSSNKTISPTKPPEKTSKRKSKSPSSSKRKTSIKAKSNPFKSSKPKQRRPLRELTKDELVKKVFKYRNKIFLAAKAKEKGDEELQQCLAEKNFGWHRLQNNDEATNSFTGFRTYQLMERVWENYLSEEAAKISLTKGGFGEKPRERSLSRQDEFLFTIMRLRTNISTTQLAFLFGAERQYANRILRTWIPYLSAKFSTFIDWVPRHETPELPEAFRGLFKKCVAVLDCFELQVQKPSNKAHRQRLWSDYKQRYTAKFLVVMAPNGTVIYISKAWGGRISDNDLVQRSTDFLAKLERNDELLADRGFKMVPYFWLNHAVHLRIPDFLKNGTFAMGIPDRTRKLAKARIHVERCIGHLRQFKILSQSLPVTMFKFVDDIATICAAIHNLCPPIVH